VAGAVHTNAGRHITQMQAHLREQVQGSQVLAGVVHTFCDSK